MSEHQDSDFKPVVPLPVHASHQHTQDVSAQQAVAPQVPAPSSPQGMPLESIANRPTSVLAVISLIMGIIGLVATLLALPALIVSIFAMKQTADNKQSGRGMAIAGLVLSIIDMLIGILFIVIFAFSFLAARNLPTPTYNTNVQSTKASSTKATLTGTVNVPVSAQKYTLTVNSVEHGYKGTKDYYAPESGNEFILVNVTLKNKDDYSQYFSSYDFTVVDSSGIVHDNKFMLNVPNDFSYKTVEKGNELTGNIVFEIPQSVAKQTLVYTPGYYSNEQAEISL